jgi:hypothetical protein
MKYGFSLVLSVAAIGLLAACSAADKEQARMDRVQKFMLEKVDITTDGIWDRAGSIITEEGEERLWPTTDEGWLEVVKTTEELADLARELKDDRYSAGNEEWKAISDGLVIAAEVAGEAALAHDEEAVFDAGGQIYRVCLACHQRFIIDTEPSE